MYNAIHSELDQSVNFVDKIDKGQVIEARYVRRNRDYFICYLSSQTACRLGCRMCHLTATKQMVGRDCTHNELYEQAQTVLEYYDHQPTADIVNYNFMARGEPFDSDVFTSYSEDIFTRLHAEAEDRNLVADFNISTIMPKDTVPKRLWKMFRTFQPNLYYSLYSTDEEFRKKWLPNAMPVGSALDILAEWQSHSHKIPRIHYAFIKGENDDSYEIEEMCRMINARKLLVDFNIVRYNPYSKAQGQEGDFEGACEIISNEMPQSKVKVIGRVGMDVKASCGMFVE